MVEKRPVLEHEQIIYKGYFSMKEIYRLFSTWMDDKGYVPVEKRVQESVTKTGKHVEIDLQPYKKYTDYAKSVIRIQISGHNMKDVEVTRDDHKQKLQDGEIRITFDSWLETDYEEKWETQPVFYVLRSLFEKYVYTPFLSGHITGVREDTLHIKEQLKAFLNLERFKE